MASEKRPRTLMRLGAPAGIAAALLVYMFLETHVLGGYVFFATVMSAMVLWSLWVTSLSHPGPVQSNLLGKPSTPTAKAAANIIDASPPQTDTAWGETESRKRVSPAPGRASSPTSITVSKKLFCGSCQSARPIRTHHCRVCNDCIVRYDHHCAWVDNCVGASNTKAFVLFLIYASITILHYLSSVFAYCSRGGIGATMSNAPIVGTIQVILVFIAAIGCMPAAVVVFSFLASTVVSIARNCTTYEAQFDAEEAKAHNRGWLLNCKEVMGPQVHMWWVPTLVPSDAPHHGTRYHVV